MMAGPCAPTQELVEGKSPIEEKWYNCVLDDAEPKPIYGQPAIDIFKRLCPEMYSSLLREYDNEERNIRTCCNREQLIVLHRDLTNVESVVGGCASCSFNFRNLWCQLTCRYASLVELWFILNIT